MARRPANNKNRVIPQDPQTRTREVREESIRRREQQEAAARRSPGTARRPPSPTWSDREGERRQRIEEEEAAERERRAREEQEQRRRQSELDDATARREAEQQARRESATEDAERASRLPGGTPVSRLAAQQRANQDKITEAFLNAVYTPRYDGGSTTDYIYTEQPLGIPVTQESVWAVIMADGSELTLQEALNYKQDEDAPVTPLVQADGSGGWEIAEGLMNVQSVYEMVTFRVKKESQPMDPYERRRSDLYTRVTLQGGNPTIADYVELANIEQLERQNALDMEGYLQTGEDYLTQDSVIDTLFQMPVTELATLKSQLIRVGALPADEMGSLYFRDVNDATIDAFVQLANVANSNDMEWQALMNSLLDSGQTIGPYATTSSRGGGGGGGGYTIRLTNEDDLKTVANQVAQQRLGRRLDDTSLTQFVSTYQQMETDFQTAYYGGAAQVTEAPSVDVAAGTQIEQNFAQEEDLYSLGTAIDTFTKLIGD